MTDIELYTQNGGDKERHREIQKELEDIGLEYEVLDISNVDTDLESNDEQPMVLDKNNDNYVVVGEKEIINYLDDNYESESWRRKDRISDIAYHIIDGILEFI